MSQNQKKRVLVVGEASFLSSGFGTYSHELLKRLHASGKYDLMELGSYAQMHPRQDPRIQEVPWKFMSAMPANEQEQHAYSSNPRSEFGELKYESACLQHTPDVTISYRDTWADCFIRWSPFREYYKWLYMPTCDASPQHPEWLDLYLNADAIFAYSDWGLELMKQQTQNKINAICAAPPGVDIDVFKPYHDKRGHRQSMGIEPNIFIVGTVNRNQKRKLYPDLIEAFAEFLRSGPPQITTKSYLYIHTSWPDLGWDIPGLITDAGIASRCLFTYLCKACGAVFPSFFQDSRAFCKHCGQFAATFPDSSTGVSRKTLADIYNCFDAYVQYANCLARGENVLLSRGWVPVEEVRIGDFAYTHNKNWKRVTNVFCNAPASPMLKLSICGDNTKLNLTSEHPVFALFRDEYLVNGKYSFRRAIGEKLPRKHPIAFANKLCQPRFDEASRLRKGDFLAFPIDDTVEDINTIDLAQFALPNDTILDNAVAVHYGYVAARHVEINKHFCRFLGLYAANGSAAGNHHAVKVTLHTQKLEGISLCLKVLSVMAAKEQVPHVRKYKNRNAMDVALYSRLHSDAFYYYCKKKANKCLPDWAMRLPLDKQKEILRGMFMGDAHYLKENKTSIYVTTSETLAEQLRFLLRRQRINYNVRLVIKGGNRRPQYRFEVYGDISNGEFTSGRNYASNFYYQGFHFLQIKEIQHVDYRDVVFNFEVEDDNSYVTKLGAVHNCEGWGLSQGEAAACGVPIFSVDYSAMESAVRQLKGFPIRVQRFYKESETGRNMAMPDNTHFVSLLTSFLMQPEQVRRRHGYDARKAVEENFTWDRTAKLWMNYLDLVEVRPHDETWLCQPRHFRPNLNVPDNLSPEHLVAWGMTHIAGRPELASSYVGLKMVRDLYWGRTITRGGGGYLHEMSTLANRPVSSEFNRDHAIATMANIGEQARVWDERRVAKLLGNTKGIK